MVEVFLRKHDRQQQTGIEDINNHKNEHVLIIFKDMIYVRYQ